MQRHRRPPRTHRSAEDFFGEIIRTVRTERGLSQETLAFESGYHPTYIGQLERGQKSPSLRTILALARALGTPGSEMLKRLEVHLERQRKATPLGRS